MKVAKRKNHCMNQNKILKIWNNMKRKLKTELIKNYKKEKPIIY